MVSFKIKEGKKEKKRIVSKKKRRRSKKTRRKTSKKRKSVNLKGGKVVIRVSKAQQRMSVYVNGRKKYTWKTTTGNPRRYKGATTPSGTYTPYGMTRLHKSKKYGWTLPYSIKVVGSLGFKLNNERGSHGCIRLSPRNASILFSLVKKNGRKNTRVVIQ